MAEAFTIRRARAADAEALTALALRSKAHWGYDEAFMAACVDELTVTVAQIEDHEFWVAECDAGEPPAGMFSLRVGPERSGYGEVHMVFVEPAHIGTGLGGRLWAHMEARARDIGVGRLGLDADPNARAYYEHMGCEVVGASPSGSIPGRMLPRMEKSLPSAAPA